MEKVRILNYSQEKGKGEYRTKDGQRRSFRYYHIQKIIPPGALAYLAKDGSLTETPTFWEKIKDFFRRVR